MSGYTLSEGTRELLAGARREAERLGAGAIGAEHVLLSLLAAEPAAVATVERIGLDHSVVTERLSAAGTRRARPAGTAEGIGEDFPLTSHAKRLLEVASRFARSSGGQLEPIHLLLAGMSEPRGALARLLGESGVDAAGAAAELASSLGVEPASAPQPPPAAPPTAERSAARPERRRTPRNEPDAPAPRPVPAQPAARPSPSKGEPGSRSRRGRGDTPDRTAAVSAPSDVAETETLEPRRPLPHLERAAARRRAGFGWKYVMLLAVPVSIALAYVQANPVLVFLATCAGIIPLASLMGEATEHLAHRSGPAVGGLLSATFGNGAVLIIALAALRAGHTALAKASIIGSILGNLLLIMGLSLVAASLHRSDVRVSRTAAGVSAAMMALAVIGLGFPAIWHATDPDAALRTELWISRAVAGILVATYATSLFAGRRTHGRLFGGDPHPVDGPGWSTGRAALVVGAATALLVWESEILVGVIEPGAGILGLSPVFLGLIVIPIIGSAAERTSAIVLARKGRTDLALQIALGSSTQVALFVAPILVAAGVLFGQGAMNLVFTPFEIAALAVSTVVISILTLDGESHWFAGIQLLAVYAMVAVAAFFI